MTPEHAPKSSVAGCPASTAGYILAAIWIFGGAIWFYIRFSIVFYTANKPSIDGALSRLLQTFGLGS